ncbi:MAG TPA: cytochrome, partial [Leptolyngbyaceae cyanobacterium]
VVIACGMSAGTAAEIALALKANKKVILLNNDQEGKLFFQRLSPENIYFVHTSVEAIKITNKFVV